MGANLPGEGGVVQSLIFHACVPACLSLKGRRLRQEGEGRLFRRIACHLVHSTATLGLLLSSCQDAIAAMA